MNKQEFKKLEATLRENTSPERRNMIVIKQHLVDRFRNQHVGGANSLAGNIPMIEKQSKTVTKILTPLAREQATLVQHSQD